MAMMGNKSSFLGVDIGSTSIKVVELKKEGGQVKLVTYGFSENNKKSGNEWQQDTAKTARFLAQICAEAGVDSKSAVSALPTFSVFSSVINLTNVSKKDIAGAVHWEAKKVIPLPLEDMILDWKQIENPPDKPAAPNNIRVLLTGAPRSLVKKYIDIFKQAEIGLLSLETETFSLVRSLLGNDRSTVMIVEFGASTTDVCIVDNSIPLLNRSIDVGGITITKQVAKGLGIDFEKAEQFKYDLGVGAPAGREGEMPKAVTDAIGPIVNEIKYAMNLFTSKNGKPVEKVVLSGGSALLPRLTDYLGRVLDRKVIIGDPWARVAYPPDLKPLLYEIGPRMSVAIGLALRELE